MEGDSPPGLSAGLPQVSCCAASGCPASISRDGTSGDDSNARPLEPRKDLLAGRHLIIWGGYLLNFLSLSPLSGLSTTVHMHKTSDVSTSIQRGDGKEQHNLRPGQDQHQLRSSTQDGGGMQGAGMQ